MIDDGPLSYNLNALKIAASVFSQITNTETILINGKPLLYGSGEPYVKVSPRTLKDFRESVDAVFKAAGLDKVEWDDREKA